ncbi:MAG: class I SAM-dependent methyltransferase [Erysipelotrichaceae bacterium]|nr:class I SAM-dependent methyltransferase [Erysipelotrichaceae bacterium]
MTRKLGVVEDTLYVPMLGRIYASENCRDILYDKKALELKDKLPEGLIEKDTQTQYTYLASASRSANMDRYIKDFIRRKPEGIVVQLGCGLETTYYRCDNGHTKWYAIDLPHVIEYRRELLSEAEREEYIPGDAFQKDWIEQIRSEHPDVPLLVTASGLFYYFEEEKVLSLLRMLQGYGEIEVLFDTVNKSGMTMMKKKHMKTVGHQDAQMYFYVDSAKELAAKIGGNVKVLAEEPFYRTVPKKGLNFATKVSMIVSDWFSMVKMIHLSLVK